MNKIILLSVLCLESSDFNLHFLHYWFRNRWYLISCLSGWLFTRKWFNRFRLTSRLATKWRALQTLNFVRFLHENDLNNIVDYGFTFL